MALFFTVLLLTARASEVVSWKLIDFPQRQVFPANKNISSHDRCRGCIANYKMGSYPDNLFFHLHIPKTGGTSFLECFNCWDAKAVYSVKGPKQGWSCGDVNIPVLKSGIADGSKRVVSCEVGGRPGVLNNFLNRLDVKDVKILTFLRKPMDHVFSALMHYKLSPNRKNPCGTFSDIFNSDANSEKNPACEHYKIQNMQTTALTSTGKANVTQAVSFVSKKVFHFGITQYFRASLCLLAFQLGQIAAKADLCDCSKFSKSSTSSVKHSNTKTNHLKGQEGADTKHVLSAADQKVLESDYINLDNVLYSISLRIFFNRIIIAENESGMQLLCPATDGEEVTVLKSSILNPRWYMGQ